jgi:hypothetical protein
VYSSVGSGSTGATLGAAAGGSVWTTGGATGGACSACSGDLGAEAQPASASVSAKVAQGRARLSVRRRWAGPELFDSLKAHLVVGLIEFNAVAPSECAVLYQTQLNSLNRFAAAALKVRREGYFFHRSHLKAIKDP